MSTTAVFGASGKLGRHLIGLLAQRGDACRALVHRTPVAGENVVSITGSITEPDAVAETVRGADTVVQLATTKEDSTTFFDVSLRGTFNVLEACRHRKIRQFLLVSGDSVLGMWSQPQPVPLDENHRRMAYPGYYAFSKVMEEVMAEQYAIQYGVPVTILRSSWIFERDDLLNHFSLIRNIDPAEKGHGFGNVTPEILELVRAKQDRIPIMIDKSGAPLRRHIVHVDDVMQAFGRALGNPSAIGQTFNISGPSAFDYRVVADYLSRKLEIPAIELNCPDYHSFEINITRARTVLGYAPENDIFRMIDRAIAFRAEQETQSKNTKNQR